MGFSHGPLAFLAGAQQGMTPMNHPLWFPLRKPLGSFPAPGTFPTYRACKFCTVLKAWLFESRVVSLSSASWVTLIRNSNGQNTVWPRIPTVTYASKGFGPPQQEQKNRNKQTDRQTSKQTNKQTTEERKKEIKKERKKDRTNRKKEIKKERKKSRRKERTNKRKTARQEGRKEGRKKERKIRNK